MKMIKITLKTALLLMVFAMIGCKSEKTYPDVKTMVQEAEKQLSFITVEELKVKIDSGDMFNLIDVREPKEYNHGYIPGAINIPRGVLEFKINNPVYWENEGMYLPAKDEEFILVCKKGSRSALSAVSLMKLGYKNVKVLLKGWKKWELTYPELQEKNLETDSHEEVEEVGGC